MLLVAIQLVLCSILLVLTIYLWRNARRLDEIDKKNRELIAQIEKELEAEQWKT